MRIIQNIDGTDIIQQSEEWYRARLGVLTGSKANKSFSAKDPKKSLDTLKYQLIAEAWTGAEPDDFKSPYMEWGIMQESAAIEEYERRTKIKTEVVGFCKHEKYDWIGLSPDRFAKINGSKVYNHAVEVKCPATHTMIKYMADGHIPSEYLPQVIHYFIVCDTLESLDLVIYDPRIQAPDFQLFKIRVTRKELELEINKRMEQYLMFRKDWEALEFKLLNLSN